MVDDGLATKEVGDHNPESGSAIKNCERWANFVSGQVKGNCRIMAMLVRINDKLDDLQSP